MKILHNTDLFKLTSKYQQQQFSVHKEYRSWEMIDVWIWNRS